MQLTALGLVLVGLAADGECPAGPAAPAAPAPATSEFREKARAAFEVEAVRMFSNIVAGMDEEMKAEALKAMAVEAEELPKALARMLLDLTNAAFQLSEEEARAIVEGRFDDLGNRARIDASIDLFAELGTPLPMPVVYWVERARARKIAPGLEREFASRLLSLTAGQVRATLKKSAPPVPEDRKDRTAAPAAKAK